MNPVEIPVKNIYYMLAYAFSALRLGDSARMASEDFDNIHDLFAAILALGIGHQLKRGLHREYVERSEALNAVRGRIDLAGTLRELRARHRRIVCEFDELCEDNLSNRILKTTALLLLRSADVRPCRKDELRREMMFFAAVQRVDPATIEWSRIRFHHSNRSYRMLLIFCRFLLEGLLLSSQSGEYRLASLIDEQRFFRLYEKFILAYFRRHHPELHPSAAMIPWALDDDCCGMLPEMQSDIMLTEPGRTLIIDAKCYTRNTQIQYGRHSLHSQNLYQIFAYVKNKARQPECVGQEVSGILLYARTRDAIQPEGDFRVSGNRISVRTLDLSVPFPAVRTQLEALVTR